MNVISTKNRKANKFHKCNLCGFIIYHGEIYNSQVIADGGDIYTFKAHLSCIDIAEKLNMFDNADDGLSIDGFHQSIKDEYENILADKGLRRFGLTFHQILVYVKNMHL